MSSITKVEMALVLSSQHRIMEETLVLMKELLGILRASSSLITLNTTNELRLMEIERRAEEMTLEVRVSQDEKLTALKNF